MTGEAVALVAEAKSVLSTGFPFLAFGYGMLILPTGSRVFNARIFDQKESWFSFVLSLLGLVVALALALLSLGTLRSLLGCSDYLDITPLFLAWSSLVAVLGVWASVLLVMSVVHIAKA